MKQSYEYLMNSLGDGNLAKEPAVGVGAVGSAVVGIAAIIDTFFPNLLTDQQSSSLFALVAILLPYVQAYLTRSRVYSPDTVKKLVDTTANRVHEAYTDKKV